MAEGKIKFFNDLKYTLKEGGEYRYPTLEERNKNKNLGDKPLDKDNHLMDCLRYICQELPYNFIDMKRATFSNYVKFFEEQNRPGVPKIESAFSFEEMIDIINKEYSEEKLSQKNKRYAGGFNI